MTTDTDDGPRLLGTSATAMVRPSRTLAPDRLSLEVVTGSGRAALIDIRVRLDLVEVWSNGEHCCGVVDRDVLRAWLIAQPRTSLCFDEVVISTDHSLDIRGRIAISLTDVHAWTLSPHEQEKLLQRV